MIEEYISQYLNFDKELRKETELEIRFDSRLISRNEYEDVLKRLKSLGFIFSNNVHVLKIMTTESNIRTELEGIKNIQYYCTNEELPEKVIFQEKTKQRPHDYKKFGFRISLQDERNVDTIDMNNWNEKKKTFRQMNRITATHEKYSNIYVDLSVVKQSKESYTFKSSDIVNSKERYEIEIEYKNYEEKSNLETEIKNVKTIITEILRGIQGTLYPVSLDELAIIKDEYKHLLNIENDTLVPRNFIGPSSISLEMEHLHSSENKKSVTILHDYCVTDKADGERKMLYISSNNKIYFITSSMKFQYTGLQCNSGFEHTLIDGECILKDKYDNPCYIYAAFDIYFINNKDCRSYNLFTKENENNARYNLLKHVFDTIQVKTNCNHELTLKVKSFEKSENVYKNCDIILNNIENGIFEYETDGLIFTPKFTGVGGDEIHNKRITWNESFKWKPPEYNTIDFLAVIMKDENNQDKIVNGSYKTLILHVGHDDNNPLHGYLQPFQDMLDDNIKSSNDKNTYSPKPFKPNSDNNDAMYCRVKLIDDIMYAENGDIIQDHTIIECKYKDKSWIPIRVRHDKTSEYRNGIKNFGNAYNVALSVWNSIHNPITEGMIRGKQEIIYSEENDDVYYNNASRNTYTNSMRDFHNLYVKSKLISCVSRPDDTLIDLAVGKAGDLSKWIRSKLSFVFGIDVSNDNICHARDGACARYLNARKKYKNMLRAIFIQGNSSNNIKQGLAPTTEKGKEIVRSIFGFSPKDSFKETLLKEYYGVGRNGFNIVSCQFAIHYFFESKPVLDEFLKNVYECCSYNGYFIGTTYDGQTLFEQLKDKNTLSSSHESNTIWEIKKAYTNDTFNNDESCLGYPIHVYQDSINKTIVEYLVHFEYLKKRMYEHGFVIPDDDELEMTTGMFSELFSKMKYEMKDKKLFKNAMNMDSKQKNISFLNRYFIFKKVSNKMEAKDVFEEKQVERHIKQDIKNIISNRKLKYKPYDRLVACIKEVGYFNKEFNTDLFIEFITTHYNKYSDYNLYKHYMDSIHNNTTKVKIDGRSDNRANQIDTLLSKFKVNGIKTFLDYGCGDGSITKSIKEKLNLDKENVYCADVKKYNSIEFSFTPITDDELDLPSNKFDLITVLMVLHHVPDTKQQQTIHDLYRLLKPGGVIVLREHNAPRHDPYFQGVIDVVHDIYDYIIDTELTWKDKDHYYSKYKDASLWDEMFREAGFQKPKGQKIIKIPNRNPQEKYMCIYKKPKRKLTRKKTLV